jgi:hypothetical protein
MSKANVVLLLFLVSISVYADEIKQPTSPTPPAGPARPVVPGPSANSLNPVFPVMPSIPVFPNRNGQTNGEEEIENYELSISEAFPGGDTRINVANTIEKAQYILYSNKNVTIKLDFKDGSQYIYYLRNPGSRIESSPGVYRETYGTTVQVGKEFLLDQYTSELYSTADTATSVTIIGNGKVIVTLRFTKKAGS